MLIAPCVQAVQRSKGGQPAAATAAKTPGINPAQLAKLRVRMKSSVDHGRAAGMVTLVAYRGKVIDHSAYGFQDLESRAPMKTETIFQIASMTKPITAAAVMILVDEGLIALTDPVQKYLPGFADIQLVVKAQDSEQGSELTEVKKPSRPITILDLLTHTSGMGGGYPEEMKDLFSQRDRTLAEAVEAFPKLPLGFEPGTKWGYSNMGIATLGRIIEIVSGQSYDQFLTGRIFEPLEMKDSHFMVPQSKHSRIATIYRLEGGKLQKADVDLYRSQAKYPAPEGGLYSTAADQFHFYQMMLNDGVFNGRRILSPASVDLMTRVHTGDLKAGFSPGIGFGLGLAVVRNVEGMFRLSSIGTFGHGGLWKTYGFADPQKDLVGIILMQRLSGDGDLADEFNAFIAIASAAVIGNRQD